MHTCKRLVLLGLLASPAAWAGKSDATLALGLGTSVGGTSGLQVGKHLSDDLGLRATVGFALGSGTHAGLGVYVDQSLLRDTRGGVQLVAGLDTRLTQAPSVDGDTVTSPDLGLGLGLQGDVFLTPSLSLYAHAGVSAWMLGRASAASSLGFPVSDGLANSGLNLALGPANALGVLGFTWWIGAE